MTGPIPYADRPRTDWLLGSLRRTRGSARPGLVILDGREQVLGEYLEWRSRLPALGQCSPHRPLHRLCPTAATPSRRRSGRSTACRAGDEARVPSEVVGRWASQGPSQLAGRDGGSRRRQSSPTRYGRCSPVCAGDERAEHRQGKTGAFDRLNSKLDAHAKKFGLDEMTCVWREAVDGMVDGAPTEIKWQYADNARRLESHPVPHQ